MLWSGINFQLSAEVLAHTNVNKKNPLSIWDCVDFKICCETRTPVLPLESHLWRAPIGRGSSQMATETFVNGACRLFSSFRTGVPFHQPEYLCPSLGITVNGVGYTTFGELLLTPVFLLFMTHILRVFFKKVGLERFQMFCGGEWFNIKDVPLLWWWFVVFGEGGPLGLTVCHKGFSFGSFEVFIIEEGVTLFQL